MNSRPTKWNLGLSSRLSLFSRFLRVRPIDRLSLHRIPAGEFLSKSTNYFLGNSAVSEERSHGVVVQVFVQELFESFLCPSRRQVGDLNRRLFKCHYRTIRKAGWPRGQCRLERDLSFNELSQVFLAGANEIVGLLVKHGVSERILLVFRPGA